MDHKKILTAFLITQMYGCASNNTQPQYVYERIFDSNISLEQAIANCRYEDRLKKEADARAGMPTSPFSEMLLKKFGLDIPREQVCLQRFGWDLKERKEEIYSKKSYDETRKLVLLNNIYNCNITKSFEGVVVNKLKINARWPNLDLIVDDVKFSFSVKDFYNITNRQLSDAPIQYATQDNEIITHVFYNGKIIINPNSIKRIEAKCDLEFK
jgi:hypothetical protein